MHDDFLEYTKPADDIRPTGKAPVIISQGASTVSFQNLRWGFKKWDGKGVIINARVETLETKDMFTRLLTTGRCIIPAGEYYEWQTKGQSKVKHLIKDKDDNLLFMAGLYQEGDNGREFVIITKDACDEVTNVHDRMPVILKASQVEDWLAGKLMPDDIVKLEFNPDVRPCDESMIQMDLFESE